jgi:glycosyltransferase involved in cell wall biosynthesis
MKIVHAVYNLEMGGAEVLVSQLCRTQRAQGHEVWVFAYARLGVIGAALRAEGFEIYVPGEAGLATTAWRYFLRLRQLRPDVVHCHSVGPTLQTVLGARLAGVRCVISTRHRLELDPYVWKTEAVYNAAGWLCSWVTGICEVTCEGVRRGPLARKKKIVLVYNGTEAVERVSADELGKDGFTLLFVGRLAPEKDLAMMIRAIALAAERAPQLRLWIVGDGSARPSWQALSEQLGLTGRVRFWGQRTDTAKFFSAADVFVMSSRNEGLPMSLLQAMSVGLPAILTDVDGMGEILRLTGSGLLVPVGDQAAMADAMVRMAGDAALRQKLSKLALEAYAREFTLEHMNAQYMDLYRRG